MATVLAKKHMRQLVSIQLILLMLKLCSSLRCVSRSTVVNLQFSRKCALDKIRDFDCIIAKMAVAMVSRFLIACLPYGIFSMYNVAHANSPVRPKRSGETFFALLFVQLQRKCLWRSLWLIFSLLLSDHNYFWFWSNTEHSLSFKFIAYVCLNQVRYKPCCI